MKTPSGCCTGCSCAKNSRPFADHEQVHRPLVDDRELADRRARCRRLDRQPQPRARHRRGRAEIDRIGLELRRRHRHQRHAADRALAGRLRAVVGMHRAPELRRRSLGFARLSGRGTRLATLACRAGTRRFARGRAEDERQPSSPTRSALAGYSARAAPGGSPTASRRGSARRARRGEAAAAATAGSKCVPEPVSISWIASSGGIAPR